MKPNLMDQAKGKLHDVTDKIKEVTGKMFGDSKTELEAKAEKMNEPSQSTAAIPEKEVEK